MAEAHSRVAPRLRARACILVVLGLTGLPAARAQINLNQLLRAAPPLRPQQIDMQSRRAQIEADRASQQDFCAKGLAWLSDTSTLPPAADPHRNQDTGGRRAGMAARTPSARADGLEGARRPPAASIPRDAWLLEDSRFAPQFGKPYDQLSPDELARFQKMGAGCRSAGRVAGVAPSDQAFFSRVFMPMLFPTLSKGVQAIRAGRQDALAAISKLDTLAPGEDGVQAYQQIAADAAQLRSFMATSEADAFDRALQAANERVVRPAMASMAQHTIARAQGYEGLVAVNKLLRELDPANRRAPSSGDAATLQQLAAKQSAIAGALAREEKARLAALGAGVVGLERGVAWSKEFNARYGNFTDVREIADVWRDFLARRGALIEASRAELSRRIGQARDAAELDALMARYLPLESDQRSEGGTALATRVAEQRDAIDKRRVLGDTVATPAADGARGGQAAPARVAAEPLAKGEPSESDMYDLVKEQFDAQARKIRQMAGMCKSGGSNDPAAALLCLSGAMGKAVGAGDAMKITKFEKLGCERASGKPGYVCDYLVGVSGGVTRAMGPSMAAIYGDDGAAQARFLKSKSGWMAFFGEKN